MSRVLIAGCGDIGATLGLGLHADGHDVWGLRRNTGVLPSEIHPVRADLAIPEELGSLPPDVDAVIYIAAADAFDDRAYEAAYVRGPDNLLRALTAGGKTVKRLIFVSSTNVYGQCNGEWVDEDSATIPGQFSGKRLLQGERLVLNGPIPSVVVRFGGIYGTNRGSLLQRIRLGSPCRETPALFTNRIHRDDCIAVLRHLLLMGGPEQVYLAVDNQPATECAVMDWLATQMGVPPPPRSRTTAGDGGRKRSNKRCRNARLLSTGYRFLHPSYRDGYGTILAHARCSE